MRFYFRYILIFLIINNKWVLVQSDDTSATPPASSGGDGTTAKIGQDASATSPTAGSTDSGTKTGVELSLKATAATPQFNYNKAGQVVTYTAKDNYAFKSVKTGDVVVWSTDNASEYATKVVLYGKGKKDKIVTIHMPDGTTKSYKKDGKNKPWNEYTGPPPSSGQSGGSSATPTDNTNEKTATVDIKKPWDTNYCSGNSGSILTYVPRGDYSINEVKEDSKEIWKTDKKDEYSKKVKADFAKNIVTIHIGPDGNSRKVYKKGSDGNWKEDTQDSTQKSSTDGSGGGGTDQSGGGTTGTGASGGGGAQQSTPATQ